MKGIPELYPVQKFLKNFLSLKIFKIEKDIESDGQINEAVWVGTDINTQNYVVYEGNT